jgi:hypothetical protein
MELTKNQIHRLFPRELMSWREIRRRCYDPKRRSYKDYGGRGITMCDHWRERFINFIIDMGAQPTNKHTIERINVNGNYEPSNCKWATMKEQANNRRRKSLYATGKLDPRTGRWYAILKENYRHKNVTPNKSHATKEEANKAIIDYCIANGLRYHEHKHGSGQIGRRKKESSL